jgi:hypothetical protein
MAPKTVSMMLCFIVFIPVSRVGNRQWLFRVARLQVGGPVGDKPGWYLLNLAYGAIAMVYDKMFAPLLVLHPFDGASNHAIQVGCCLHPPRLCRQQSVVRACSLCVGLPENNDCLFGPCPQIGHGAKPLEEKILAKERIAVGLKISWLKGDGKTR